MHVISQSRLSYKKKKSVFKIVSPIPGSELNRTCLERTFQYMQNYKYFNRIEHSQKFHEEWKKKYPSRSPIIYLIDAISSPQNLLLKIWKKMPIVTFFHHCYFTLHHNFYTIIVITLFITSARLRKFENVLFFANNFVD